MDVEAPSEPDSTTAERELLAVREFAVDDDVLCNISRGDQLYLGVVVQVNHVLKKCLVKFLDNTETWCPFADMKFFSLGEQEVTCVVCKSTEPGPGNQLQVCSCGRGYHQRCHQPNIPPRDPAWKCRICSPARRRDACERATKQPVLPLMPAPQQLEQQQQCLNCSRKDVWHCGMLQCRRCRHWLHGSCLPSLKQPVLNGDRFYVLVCASCNRGRELCYRLALTWPDLVHITLFNLNQKHHSKYHDLDEAIMPFLNRVWSELQLPAKMAASTKPERRRQVETALQSGGKRFRCGREAKKRVALWGLRSCSAPRPPPINLPSRGPVEEYLNGLGKNLILPPEQPLQNGFVNSSRKEDDIRPRLSCPAGCSTPSDTVATDAKVDSSAEFHGRGLVKRSVPFPLVEASGSADARFISRRVRRAKRVLQQRISKPRRDAPRLSDSEDEALRSLFREAPTRSAIPHFLPKTEKKESKTEIRKRPQRNLLEARLNSTESKLYNPQAVAAAAATPVEPSPKKKVKKGEGVKNVADRLKLKRKFVQKTILETLQPRTKWRTNGEGESNSSADERTAPLKTVITKRQLSEKDIVVDEHGVVRRRRRYRRLPLHIRRLLLKPPPPPRIKYEAPMLPPSSAPASTASFFSMPMDLEAVKELLGPLPRVLRGEPYQVTSRRVLPNGQVDVMLVFPHSSPLPVKSEPS